MGILFDLVLIIIGTRLLIKPPFFLVWRNPDMESAYKFIGGLCVVFGALLIILQLPHR